MSKIPAKKRRKSGFKSSEWMGTSTWMRPIGRIITVIWGVFWLLISLLSMPSILFAGSTEIMYMVVIIFILIPSIIVPFIWEIGGGFILVIEGVIITIWYVSSWATSTLGTYVMVSTYVTLAVPPIIAGILFVTNQVKSTTT